MGLLYLSYLHSNIRLKPIINWVFKKCNPVKSQTQIPSFELYTKWPISNRTKATVPKPVIWSSVWSEFASLWKQNQNETDTYPKEEKNKCFLVPEKYDNQNSWRGQQKLDTEKALCFGQLFLFCQKDLVPSLFSHHLISKLLSGWEKWSQENFQKWWMMTNILMKKKAQRFILLQNITPKATWRDLRHFTLSTNF